ncbi:MAG: NADPH:quinone reductase [Oligoflexia bacterium]|nr:NADPH:quinone reductase [Oligoflexia bacterium]
MKAIRVKKTGGPEVLEMEEIPDPKADHGQVVVRVFAAGVNPVDTYIRSGNYPLNLVFPYTPGIDGAGIIQAISPDVEGNIKKGLYSSLTKDLKVGSRVYIAGSLSGTYAQLALCEISQVYPLPDDISFSQGAGINVPYVTAYRALFNKAYAGPGQWLLIHGASGGVGTALLQLARSRGLRIIGTAGTQKGQQLVKDLGADYVLNHLENDYLNKIRDITKGKGVKVIIEMLANKNLQNDLSILALHGVVVIVGSRGTIEIDPRLLMSNEGTVKGILNLKIPEEESYQVHSAIASGLKNHIINPIIRKEIPLTNASEAHTLIMQEGAYGKIVLLP